MQSLCLKLAIASFHLQKQKSFNQVKIYDAPSRVTGTNNLFLTGSYSNRAFQVNRDAVAEHNTLRDSSNFIPWNTIDITDDCFTVSLSNKNRMENGILCFTETQVSNENDVAQLASFGVYLNSIVTGFKILDSFLVRIHSWQRFILSFNNGMETSILEIKKTIVYPDVVKMLLYCSPNSSLIIIFYNRFRCATRDGEGGGLPCSLLKIEKVPWFWKKRP